MASLFVTIVSVTAQPACHKSGEDESGPEIACARQIRVLQTWLDAMVQDLRWAGGPYGYRSLDGGERIFEQSLARAPWLAGGAPVTASVKLTIPAGEVAPWNREDSNFLELDLVVELQQDIISHEKLFPGPDPTLVNLIVDAQAPWSRVVLAAQVTRKVTGGWVQILFLPEAGRHAKKPPQASFPITAELLWPKSEDGKFLFPQKGQPTPSYLLFERIAVGCAELADFHRKWKSSEYGNPGVEDAFLVQCAHDLPRALIACACAVEIPALQNLLWVSRPIPLVARRVRLVEQDEWSFGCTRIAAAAKAPWASVVPAILAVPEGKALCFELQAESGDPR